MKSIIRTKILLILLFVVTNLYSQTTTQPTPLSGSTSISFDGTTYTFNGVGVTYKYPISGDIKYVGSLIYLTAKINGNGFEFYPSYLGGVAANLNGVTLKPWSEDYATSRIRYQLLSNYQAGNEILITWRMYYFSNVNEFCDYTYAFSILGQTLKIRILGATNFDKIEGVGFNQAFPKMPSTQTMRVVNIPYLPIMNVLYNSTASVFASLFTDWESTNASGIVAWNGGSPTTSSYYSQRIDYEKKTDGTRNQLNETIYLSIASNMKDVIPNLAGSAAPNRNAIWNKIVISYFKPFPYLLWQRDPQTGTSFGYISDLYLHFGVRDAAFIIKNWGQGQFDDQYPTTWPPDSFTVDKGYGTPGFGGINGLKQVIDTLKYRGYWFALHENYTDYYPYPGSYSYGKLPYLQGDSARTFLHKYKVALPSKQSYLLKPSILGNVVTTETGRITTGLTTSYLPNWSYLDVSSGVNPSGQQVTKDQYHSTDSGNYWSYVDFSGDGKFKSTVDAYRNLASTIRSSYNGPVEGEGGYHFLYAGYFDDFEGRLQTGGSLEGYNAPIILEFSKKIRDKSAIHGVGHIQWFYGDNNNLDTNQVKRYMATELAYGHAALVTTAPGGVSVNTDIAVSRLHAQWAQQYIRWVQQLYSTAQVSGVTYWDASGEVGDASAYIKKYPNDFDNINSFNFMGRVKVTYSNSMEIWVNRTKWSWDYLAIGGRSGFYCYNIVSGSGEKMGIGNSPAPTVFLPAESGWFVYSPTWPSFSMMKNNNLGMELTKEIPVKFNLEQNYPNPFNPSTLIKYSVPAKDFISLKVFDLLGREVTTLVNEVREPGSYSVSFDGSKLSSGVYIYTLSSSNQQLSKKLLLVK